MDIFEKPHKQTAKEWWRAKRRRYNIGLVLAGIIAFLLYDAAVTALIMPYDKDFEINGLITIMQGIVYLMMIGVANLFYYLGYWADITYNKSNITSFRVNLFNIGFWFSFALPFMIPVLVVVQYFVRYRW
jgi:hypothetical protein